MVLYNHNRFPGQAGLSEETVYKILWPFGNLQMNPLYLTLVVVALLLLAMAQSYASAKKMKIGPALILSFGVLVVGLVITYFMFTALFSQYNRQDYVFENVSIYSYGFMLMLAFVFGTIFLVVQGKKENPPVPMDTILDLMVFIIIGSILGARAVYVATQPGDYVANPENILKITEGGLSIHGGIIGAMLFGWFYTMIKGLNYWRMSDFMIVSLPLGQFFGRIGCFLNGCCFGKECRTDFPLGVTYPNAETWADRGFNQNLANLYDSGLAALPKAGETLPFIRHPAPLYEAFGVLLIFWYLLNFRKNKIFTGHVFLMYVVLYSVLRFFVEDWRFGNTTSGEGSAVVLFNFITVAQLASVILAVAGITLIQDLKRRTLLAKMLVKGKDEEIAEEEISDVEYETTDVVVEDESYTVEPEEPYKDPGNSDETETGEDLLDMSGEKPG